MTSTGIEHGLDIEILNFLDYEHSIPCDARSKDQTCDKPADWQVMLSCCGAVYFFCDMHLQFHLDALSEGMMFSHTNKDGCGAEYIKNPFLSIEKI